MNISQDALAEMCPPEVGEYIDEKILPEYANGKNTAKMIANSMAQDALERLNLKHENHIEYYKLYSDLALIDPYISAKVNRCILVGYIQTIFDEWENEC
ncbi:hypothetical protein [Enterococcus gilvus]|uniref:Uncharacterized protein n=1 Tax=Enterococcus gilvus ATCC BAA-350 TaxID=1158614 RepID=R2XTV2_9ENTE|nr:hypothetical protein [Enterococcus gilvus]EOI53412.1 hypothetical protein UKC_03364 [Enterococcus gilvus ATCC BAA-350]EOW81313.1 hypothetical protein I592_00598 [Enterococcus gilvus ATCC BAA-350]OJG42723.1 hypothetical protein RV02_GL003191 [Enterococcus gilvus]